MTCHDPACARQFLAGMAYRCDECGNQFCSEHLFHTSARRGQFCEDCSDDEAQA